MNVIFAGVVAGFLLSLYQIEGLRRTSRKMLSGSAPYGDAYGSTQARKWAWFFAMRWGIIAVCFWLLLHAFGKNIWPFVFSFIISGTMLRRWYGRKAYAG